MRTTIALPIVFALAATPIFGTAWHLQAAGQHHTVVPADAVKWGPAPPSLPPGASAAVLLGNPAVAGPFVLRLKLPAGFVIPPHRHSKDELVTVISGGFGLRPANKWTALLSSRCRRAASSIFQRACRTMPGPMVKPSCRSTVWVRSTSRTSTPRTTLARTSVGASRIRPQTKSQGGNGTGSGRNCRLGIADCQNDETLRPVRLPGCFKHRTGPSWPPAARGGGNPPECR